MEVDVNSYPRFTVIIPAKNRGKYLYHTLKTCMMQDYPNFEIIISDDASTDDTKRIVCEAQKNDNRIIYYHHADGLGMRENFEFALRKVKPGYVLALGADDGLLPRAIWGMYKVLKETGMELLTWPSTVYTFPSVFGEDGQLTIYHKRGIKIVKSKDFLTRQTRNLWYLNDVECPMFYVKGVVSTELVNKVCSRTEDGRFYSCPTPDGYSGIVLAGEVSEYAFSGEPFTIFGTSASSQGLAYLSNDDKAKMDSEKFFQDVSSKKMHKELASQPYSPLITLMTVDYLLTAKDLPGWSGSFPDIDYKKVLSNSIKELSLGVYGEDRIIRELRILKNIADYHGLISYYNNILRKSRRYNRINYFTGSGISPNVIYLDGSKFEIENIVDAAYAAKNIYKIYDEMNPKNILNMVLRSFNYYLKRKKKGAQFPSELEINAN